MANTIEFSLYDAFTSLPFGGGQAGVVVSKGELNAELRQNIAFEVGKAATAFISDYDANSITVRFHSPTTEYPMCGHGTLCVVTEMLTRDIYNWAEKSELALDLKLPQTTSHIEVVRNEEGDAVIMLDIVPHQFPESSFDAEEITKLLSVNVEDINTDMPIELACGDFNHLVVPFKTLEAVARIQPNYTELNKYCIDNNVQTVICYCDETQDPRNVAHLRDFCPAVGVDESAAGGTTNAGLAAYLFRNGLNKVTPSGIIKLRTEQGIEMKRPSTIETVINSQDGELVRLQVGGVAIKTVSGHLPFITESDLGK